MTSPVTPPDVILPSAYPALGSPNFNLEAYNAATSLPAAFTRQGEIAVATKTNADSAAESAGQAQSAAVVASDVQDVVLAAANFKGLWSSLTGALAKPACVKHGGRFWLLLNNLADVTASEPGISADWTNLDAGVTPSAVITGNTTVVPGVRYLIGAAGLILSMVGVTWAKGDYFGVREVIASGSYTINFSATKDRTVTRGSVVIKAGFRQLDRYFEDATRGLT